MFHVHTSMESFTNIIPVFFAFVNIESPLRMCSGDKIYRLSFLSASMGFCLWILRIAYSMVTNTTENTLAIAMPMATHGNVKLIVNPSDTIR